MLFNNVKTFRIARKLFIGILCIGLLHSVSWAEPDDEEDDPSRWKPLAQDGLHDPTNPAIHQKQNPADAFRTLPPDFAGNKVNWVKAIEDGDIIPRTSISDSNRVQPVLDMNVILDHTADMPMVRFPHKPHTQWLDCSNCHDWLFKQKARATNFGMFDVLSGEFCGRCHGAVAFPLTACDRCHSVYRTPDGLPPGKTVNEKRAFKGYDR